MANQPKKELTITRIFDAPRKLVFKAWTDTKQLAKWWGPNGFTSPRCELDARKGGAIHIDMRGPDGAIYPMTGTVKEINEPEKFVFHSSPMDSKGNPLFDVLTTVTFAEQNGKTKLTMHAEVTKIYDEAAAAQSLNGMDEGWSQTLDRLGAFVAKGVPQSS